MIQLINLFLFKKKVSKYISRGLIKDLLKGESDKISSLKLSIVFSEVLKNPTSYNICALDKFYSNILTDELIAKVTFEDFYDIEGFLHMLILRKYNIQKETLKYILRTNNAEHILDLSKIRNVPKNIIIHKLIEIKSGWALLLMANQKSTTLSDIQEAIILTEDIFNIRRLAEEFPDEVDTEKLMSLVISSGDYKNIIAFGKHVKGINLTKFFKLVSETKNKKLIQKVLRSEIEFPNKIELLSQQITARLHPNPNYNTL